MEHGLIHDIAICIIGAWVVGVGAHFLKQPLILAYLVAGFILGPIGFGLVKERENVEVISEIGLSLLLFLIGLEIDLKKMAKAGPVITITAAAQILGGCALGVFFFWMLGFPFGGGQLDALYLGVAGAISSTVIIVKILYDKRELDTLAGRLTLGILVLQDLFAILFLALQPNLQNPAVGPLLLSLGKVVVLVAMSVAASRFALPPIFKAMARVPELVMVGSLAWCFLVASIAHALGLSREMGALVAGVALSSSPYTLDVAAKLTTLRDFFITLFFVALGMNIPPPSWQLVAWACLFALFVLVSRFATVFPVLHARGYGHRMSLLPAINLSQISEFSLVILILGLNVGHISSKTRDLGAYSFVLMAVASTYLVARSDGVVRRMSPWLKTLGVRDLGDETEIKEAGAHGHGARIFLLGFFRTESSLLEELQRGHPELIRDLAVVDFNPRVNEELRRRGVRVIYGDISQRDTLVHAGVAHAETLICAVPGDLLKGITKTRLVRQLRELNSTAKIIVTAASFTDVPDLYAAGADFVSVPRLAEATEICTALQAAQKNTLSDMRLEMDRYLAGRAEVVP